MVYRDRQDSQMMTVRQLIEKLQTMDQDVMVLYDGEVTGLGPMNPEQVMNGWVENIGTNERPRYHEPLKGGNIPVVIIGSM